MFGPVDRGRFGIRHAGWKRGRLSQVRDQHQTLLRWVESGHQSRGYQFTPGGVSGDIGDHRPTTVVEATTSHSSSTKKGDMKKTRDPISASARIGVATGAMRISRYLRLAIIFGIPAGMGRAERRRFLDLERGTGHRPTASGCRAMAFP